MDNFLALFGPLIRFSYHCFDRIVINGYLRLLTRPNNVSYFYRQVKQEPAVTKELLRKRTDQYVGWVEAYAKRHKISLQWAEKDARKKDELEALRVRRQKKGFTGVYAIVQSMEQGPSFRISKPKFPPPNDPNWNKIAAQWSRYRHYYFYILDDVLGPFSMRVGTFLPFESTHFLNGHEIIDRALRKKGVTFRRDDNAFISVGDPRRLQQAADSLTSEILQDRIDYWAFLLGPKFSRPERHQFDLRRSYFFRQVEYAHNFIFSRNAPLHTMYERACDLGLMRITPQRIAQIFGWRLERRIKGKLQTVLEQIQHGHHVLRAYAKNSFVKQYEKRNTFLRMETCSNNLKDFALKKSIQELPNVRQALSDVNDRFAQQQAELFNVIPDHPLLERLAKPKRHKSQRVPGIRIDQERPLRILEVLLSGRTQLNGWTAKDLLQAVQQGYDKGYTRAQLAYDLRKLKAHGIVERIKKCYRYQLSDEGKKIAATMVLLRNRILKPIPGSIFEKPVHGELKPKSKIERQYRKASKAIVELIDLLKTG